jgi:hypothetical protein
LRHKMPLPNALGALNEAGLRCVKQEVVGEFAH